MRFPGHEHLELLLGEPNYGFDGGVEDLQPLLSGKLYPKLKFLGLMNSEIANDIAAVVVNSPIVERIEILDLSMGTIDDEGIKSLHGLVECKNLKQLNVSHHYANPATIEELKKGFTVSVIATMHKTPTKNGGQSFMPSSSATPLTIIGVPGTRRVDALLAAANRWKYVPSACLVI